MKQLHCISISIVVSLLLHCEGKPRTSKPFTTTTATTTTTTASKTAAAKHPVTTEGPGVNLKGKMVTGVTFYPHYHSGPGEGSVAYAQISATTPNPTDTTIKYTTKATTMPQPTPATRGVSVCLRVMSDGDSLNLFKAPGSPLRLSRDIAGSSQDLFHSFSSNSYSQVTLSPPISTAQTEPWTSICLVLDSVKNVVQIFEGGAMSIQKIQPSKMVGSGEPVLDISGFDGQVTDLEVWDYPLKYRQVFRYLQNYRSSGTVLTWSNIVYRFRGNARFEEAYALRQREPISSSGGQEQPIQSRQGHGQRLTYRKMFNGKRQRRRMF